MLPYLRIIRPINLGFIALALGLFKYTFLDTFPLSYALSPLAFWGMVIATMLIAAGGNVINDIQDVAIDTINKPQKVIVTKTISEKAAYNYYMFLTITGVLLGFWVANAVGKPSLAILFIGSAALLYVYATSIKSMLLIGNLLVSALVGLSVLLLVLFAIFPMLEQTDNSLYKTLSKVIFMYAIAAFYINLMRELVKDMQDINGDQNGGRKTLPIVLGISRTTMVVFAMGVFAFFLLLFFCYYELYPYPWVLFYFLVILGGNMLFF